LSPPPAEKDPRRWMVVVLCSLITIGNYMAFGIPAFLELEMKRDLNLSAVEYNLLFTIVNKELMLKFKFS